MMVLFKFFLKIHLYQKFKSYQNNASPRRFFFFLPTMVQYPHMSSPKHSKPYLFFTGLFMGTADLIPGVSGGTIALLAGVYERLIRNIKTFTGESMRLALRGRFREAWRATEVPFLITLGLGIITAIISLAHLLTWLLHTYPAHIYALFFGLVAASTLVVLRRIDRIQARTAAGFILAATAMYVVAGITPATASPAPLLIFVSGVLAISAMVLPGISGSFILLIVGQYEHILTAVTERDVLTLGIFIAGCIVGIAVMVRIITWLFARYHNLTIAILAGIMFGSLRKLWPWQEFGDLVAPTAGMVALTALILCGIAIVFLFEKKQQS